MLLPATGTKEYSLEEENTIQSLELSLGFVTAASDRVGLGKQAQREGRKGPCLMGEELGKEGSGGGRHHPSTAHLKHRCGEGGGT